MKELLKLDAEIRIVDLFTGEHYQEWYTAINPKKKVPGNDKVPGFDEKFEIVF